MLTKVSLRHKFCKYSNLILLKVAFVKEHVGLQVLDEKHSGLRSLKWQVQSPCTPYCSFDLVCSNLMMASSETATLGSEVEHVDSHTRTERSGREFWFGLDRSA